MIRKGTGFMKRVLVVEDEASIREMVALNLKMAGWEVVEAPSAERALELMHGGEPCDAALLDIMLPGMDGLSLCETIRRDDSDIGIIIVSAKGQESDKIRGLSIGADDYITKPFSVSELIARLEALTRRIHRGSSGSVPKLKQSILSPPRRALPLASASSSILCKGPQGIKPFRRPMQKGDSPFGRRNFTFRPGNFGSSGRRASIFSPIISIAAPANSFSAPWKP